MSTPEIFIFFSDQHDARLLHGMGNPLIRTPNLDRLMNEGTAFMNAYTSFPLCVPARMSFLSGQLASHTGITTNGFTLPMDQATFIHSLAVKGYDTILCGRMHFNGLDQRHGFTQRYVGDMTPVLWHRTDIDKERGEPFTGNFGQGGCTGSIGYGNSPVLEYDRDVVKACRDHFAKNHDKPQCMVLGTYGPHFPYTAPRELYEYYIDKVELPDTFGPEYNDPHPVHKHHFKERDAETAKRAMAAYYGMVEQIDMQVGQAKDVFDVYCKRNNKEGIFIYMSDHGDLNGEHNQYGKMLFYEGASRIPLIWCGVNIKAGSKITSPVNIMDIGPTLCEITGAPLPPAQDGGNLTELLTAGREAPEWTSISEVIDTDSDRIVRAGRMMRKGDWKLFLYHGLPEHDRLYNIGRDPQEKDNCVAKEPAIYAELKELIYKDWEPDRILTVKHERDQHVKIIRQWWEHHHPEQDERWRPRQGIVDEFTAV